MILYPAIDLLNGQCVRLVQGDYAQATVFHDDPTVPALEFLGQDADRLHVVDLDGAKLGTPTNGPAIRAIIDATGLPCQLGGGIRTERDLETVFSWGVRWAVLGTKALQDPNWLLRMTQRFPDRLVLGIDARNGFVATDGWLNTSSTLAVELVQRFGDAALAAVVYTDIARDGMMQGPNLPALLDVKHATRLPVIASGGISTLDEIRELARNGVHAAIIGRALYDEVFTLEEAIAVAG